MNGEFIPMLLRIPNSRRTPKRVPWRRYPCFVALWEARWRGSSGRGPPIHLSPLWTSPVPNNIHRILSDAP